MITLDDWSELITIDYPGGLSGEFFGLLLHENINPAENVYFKCTNYNKYDFKPYDVFSDNEKSTDIMKLVAKKIGYYQRKKLGLPVDIDSPYYNSIYEEIFKGKKNFYDSFRKFIYDKNKEKFDGNLKIALFHSDNHDNKTLQKLFPKSKNIVLDCPDYYCHLAKFLCIVKIIEQKQETKTLKKEYIIEQYENKWKNYFDYLFGHTENAESTSHLKIDMYSFLYEQKNYDKELSFLLGMPINLNKNKIKEYAQKNIDIFKTYELDINQIYNKSYFNEKLYNFLYPYMK